MDDRYYNLRTNKKFAEWVRLQGTLSTDYDLGPFYVSNTVKELLETYFYAKRNLSNLTPEEEYEVKKENYEIYFMDKVFGVYTDVNLSKLIENRKDTWSLHQLLKVVRKYNWPETEEIQDAINAFAKEIKHIQTARHERHAHTSQKNEPNLFHVPPDLESYRNKIKKAMELVDRFVDGEIQYVLHYSELEECDLRNTINSM